MACPTAQRVGTCGATTASLCPLRPFRTGSRLGGKKAQARMDTDFLDWALADFSGYVAADELEFISIKSLAATGSNAPGSCAGHSSVPSPARGPPPSTDACGPSRSDSA